MLTALGVLRSSASISTTGAGWVDSKKTKPREVSAPVAFSRLSFHDCARGAAVTVETSALACVSLLGLGGKARQHFGFAQFSIPRPRSCLEVVLVGSRA